MSVSRIRGPGSDHPSRLMRDQHQTDSSADPVTDVTNLLETAISKQPVACLLGGLFIGVLLGCIVKRR